MLNATAPYRRGDASSLRAPVVLPLLKVSVDSDGALAVALNHEPYAAERSLSREDLKALVDEAARNIGTAVRVEVRESDGTSFVDIITPPRPVLDPAEAEPPPSSAGAAAGEVAGQGFAPNEDIAIAVVVASQVADADGTARLRVPPALLATHPGRVVLLGESSGVVALGGGPA